MILWVVAAASPDTIRLEGTYNNVKTPSGTVNRYRDPASLAIIRGDVLAVRIIIAISPKLPELILYSLFQDESH